jgi:effector-binding domain-containing protein
MPLVEVRLSCKNCAREFVREVPEELVSAAEEDGITLTGSCYECIEGGHAGPLKKLMREFQRLNRE